MNAAANPFNPDAAPAQEWADPMPLAGVRHAPETYPLDALPDGLRAAVADVHATTQAPLAMVATGALTALSLAGQAHVNVARNKHLTGPVSLFALVLAESGERKSTVDGFFTQAIRDYEAARAEALKPEVDVYQADMHAWGAKKVGVMEAIKKAVKGGNPSTELENALRDIEQAKPEAPKVPELIYGDATPEALTHGLATKWPSGGVISSEAGTVFGSHGMGADSIMRNLAALNVLWDGGVYKVSRRSVEGFAVRNARLTVSLQVQYPVLAGFMGKQGDLARGSGFLARFLVAWPESTQGTRQYQEPDYVLAGLAGFNARITQLLTEPVPFDETGDGVAPAMLELSPEAKQVWVNVYDLIESQLAPLGSLADVKDVASKTADNAARIAALFHLYESGAGGGAIPAQAMQSACKIAMWHLEESRRLLTELGQDPALSLAARLDAWLIARCNEHRTNRINTRDVLQYFPSTQLRKVAQLTPILQELVDADRASQVIEGRKKLIVINPKLLNGGELWA
ncbi:YfjI family protein [Alcaligenes faecalis]|uniref:YfjI family protein n=1 Tax=Alcaligenes faecalis TaxID=511 RepID=UPI00214FD782|nr:YfjI family protein [Alcaligenes faecalis]MCR4143670.1 YfjI family protein [Alcaligenes faecalis]WGQ35354.1 YfjI family protein [Alcaligenes faecalis]